MMPRTIRSGVCVISTPVVDQYAGSCGFMEFIVLNDDDNEFIDNVSLKDEVALARTSLEECALENSPQIRTKGWTDEVASVRYCL